MLLLALLLSGHFGFFRFLDSRIRQPELFSQPSIILRVFLAALGSLAILHVERGFGRLFVDRDNCSHFSSRSPFNWVNLSIQNFQDEVVFSVLDDSRHLTVHGSFLYDVLGHQGSSLIAVGFFESE